MNTTPLMLLGALLASPAMAEDVSRTMDADSDGLVMISNTAGSVEVIGWSRDEVEVTGTLGDDVKELIFERDGDEVLIKVKTPSSSGFWGSKDIASNLTIKVPKGSSLEVATISAEIDVTDVHGEQELQAISGDIETEAFGEDIQIESVSGDIAIEGNGEDSDTEIESVSGNISLLRLAGDLEAGSVSGYVIVDEGSFDSVEIETVNGDINYEAELRDNGDLDVESINGNVRIDFVGEVSANFDIETFNGDIDNCFGPKPERPEHGPGVELSFGTGDEDGDVSVETLNGGVHICTK